MVVAMINGYIKLHRSLTKWEWYTDANTLRLFLHCLLMANHSDVKFRGTLIKRGSFQTSFQLLSTETGMSVQNIRTSLNKLELTGELTHQSTTKNSIIIINNYNEYQSDNKQTNKQVTNNQQATNKPLTTNNNDKNIKNEKKEPNKPLGEILGNMILDYTTNPELQKSLKEFVEFRKGTKPPLSEVGLTKVINKLEKLYPLDDHKKIECIDQSIENGWKGLFPLTEQKQSKKSPIEMLEEGEWMI